MRREDEMVREFFGSLYEGGIDPQTEQESDRKLNGLINGISARKDGVRATGDQALQILMFNFILSKPEHIEQGKKLTAVLGNIQQRLAIGAFSERFPKSDINSLIGAAKAEGYDVEVLSAD